MSDALQTTHNGFSSPESLVPGPEVGLKRRIITRTARNHLNGRAADGLLYSLEVIDPILATPEVSEDTGLRFFCPVTGSPEQLELVGVLCVELFGLAGADAIAPRYNVAPTQPVLAVRLQEMFGLARTPSVAGGRQPLLIHLLSPAGRPVQITSDLAGFWRNGYPEVKKELKGRYPKHAWPENPLNAVPTARAKPRSRRRREFGSTSPARCSAS